MTPQTQRLFLALALVVLLCPLACGVDGAPAAVPAREYLDQAKAAAFEIPLPGDQSAAFLEISLALVDTDPAAALDLAARMRRTFDSARALGAAAVAISPSDPVGAVEHVLTAGRLLLGITDPDQRLAEQRLLLREVAPLGEAALPAGPELSPGEAQLAVVLARAESDPTAALVLLRKWQLRDAAYDRAAALIADRMAVAQPEEALALAAMVLSSAVRDQALWRIAEQRPEAEAEGIATRVSDPIIQSAILRSAALRFARGGDADTAARIAALVTVARTSVQAEIAVAIMPSDSARGSQLAQELPGMSSQWARERALVAMAVLQPAAAEQALMGEPKPWPEAACAAVLAMLKLDPQRAVAVARSQSQRGAGDAVIASVVRELAGANPALAQELLSEMGPSPWRDDATEAVAVALAPSSADRATGLIGLVADPTRAAQVRARVAAAIAGQNPAAAERLLASLPPSDAKTTGSLDAAVALLAAGGQPDTAVRLGSLNLQRDLAIRWIVPQLARAQTRSPVSLSGSTQSPYLRAISLADAAGEMLGRARVPRPAPDRAAQIRPIVEWEGMAENREPGVESRESAADVTIKSRIASPSAITVRIDAPAPGKLYRATYDDGRYRFVWDSLAPDAAGLVTLADDRHLCPEYRMRCESRTGPADPVVFDDLLKGAVVGTHRQPFGVPVSTFGGPGYLVPGLADLKRDSFGNFWLYLDHPPYAILKYGPDFSYRFALLLPGPPLAHDLDGGGNLYILHEGNWVSKHGPLGQELGAWELPTGRSPGEFISASGLAIDQEAGCIYLADEMLGRVQRFGLDLRLRPLPFTPWGWIGRGDMAYTRAGEYDRDLMSYQLDRPRQLLLDGRGNLLVSCEHYISKFDLGTGKQAPFGRSPVLGWGVTFTDSAFSPSAGLDGHWQRHWLAGVDAAGDVWVADRENEFAVDPRLQVFGPDGTFRRVFDIEDSVRDAAGRPVYITAVKGVVCAADALYLVDAAGRVYRSPSPTDIVSGGTLYLGPGAAGRQFDLRQLDASKLSLELQPGPVKHPSTGRILAADSRRGPGNCEREGSTSLGDGERSLWAPARIGEPFTVMLLDAAGTPIAPTDYTVECEEKPGIFGSCFDFFRVTNRSGRTWTGVTFVAESVG